MGPHCCYLASVQPRLSWWYRFDLEQALAYDHDQKIWYQVCLWYVFVLAAQEQAVSDLVWSLMIQTSPFSFSESASAGKVSLYWTKCCYWHGLDPWNRICCTVKLHPENSTSSLPPRTPTSTSLPLPPPNAITLFFALQVQDLLLCLSIIKLHWKKQFAHPFLVAENNPLRSLVLVNNFVQRTSGHLGGWTCFSCLLHSRPSLKLIMSIGHFLLTPAHNSVLVLLPCWKGLKLLLCTGLHCL